MLLEVLGILKYAAVQVITSTVKSIEIMAATITYVFEIILADWAVSGMFEKIVVLVFGIGIVYSAYKFFWDSAKVVVLFIAFIFLIFFLEAFLF